ncbi:hypothetical protein COP2_004526 [Malus domestica]
MAHLFRNLYSLGQSKRGTTTTSNFLTPSSSSSSANRQITDKDDPLPKNAPIRRSSLSALSQGPALTPPLKVS